jgi:ubiquinone/menaquinone biosynthesis C-methylase UbiE
VDHLLALGLDCVTVLDVSGTALARARARLASVPNAVEWIEADVTGVWA